MKAVVKDKKLLSLLHPVSNRPATSVVLSAKSFSMTWTHSSFCSGSKLYILGMATAAVLRTYGDMSEAASLIASIMMGTMTGTRMEDRTRRADARIS